MAVDSFPLCLAFTLAFEGGFVDDHRDPGGATNLGVTIATLGGFLGRAATVEDVRALTKDAVTPLYRKLFWNKVEADDLPAGVDLAVFDFAVHSGPVRSAVALQRLLGVADDGRIGPATIAAAAKHDAVHLVQQICAARLAFLSQLKVYRSFGPGLRNRVERCETAALSILGAPAQS